MVSLWSVIDAAVSELDSTVIDSSSVSFGCSNGSMIVAVFTFFRIILFVNGVIMTLVFSCVISVGFSKP